MSMRSQRPQTGRRSSLRLALGIAAVAVAILAVYGWASLLHVATPESETASARILLVSPANAAVSDERSDYFPAQFRLRGKRLRSGASYQRQNEVRSSTEWASSCAGTRKRSLAV